ncbi:hypothetical protein BHE74_00047645 [Ensete ventricosum]|nr:hypothetical protein BHE74_00047645 [Ensete ventricosum]
MLSQVIRLGVYLSHPSIRALHVPLFPLPSTPPPATSPFPKYPFSSSSSSSSSSTPQQQQQGFFPSYPAPPATTQPTFPANLSSLIFPSSSSAPPRHAPASQLLPAVLLPLLALAALAAAAAFFIHRRLRPSRGDDARSDSLRLVPPCSAAPDRKPPAAPDFLYLGTLVDSRGHYHPPSSSSAASEPAARSPPLQKAGSPELRPLPPLSRQVQHGYENADGGGSPAEEFYSPDGPSSPGNASPPAEAGNRASGSSTLSTGSYPSSNSVSSPSPSSPTIPSPPIGYSPAHSSGRSVNSKSERDFVVGGVGFQDPLQPPPPPPPLTPSPPKRRPPSPSPPFSPMKKESGEKVATLDFSGPKTPPLRFGGFSRNPLAVSPPPPQEQAPSPPPPPPPPPPPSGYWENHIKKPVALQPPDLVLPKPESVKDPSSSENVVGKSEEIPRPKLKPLLWDKVRASSDRAMVWDQLKTSSFQ